MSKGVTNRIVFTFGSILTILISLFTILGSIAPRFTPSTNSVISLLGIAFPILVILNVIIIVFWILLLRFHWIILPLIALGVSTSQIGRFFQPSFLHHQAINNGNFRIANYNVAAFNNPIGAADAIDLAKYMAKQKVDVLCFQEFRGNENLTDSMLIKIFKQWPYHSIPNIKKETLIRPAVFSKYPIHHSELIRFKESKNAAISCLLNIKGKTILLLNNHLQTTDMTQISHGERSTERIVSLQMMALAHNSVKRGEQARQIQQYVKSSSYPVLLCGDFNDPAVTYTYETMRGNLKDGFIEKGSGYMYTYRYAHKLFRIDYIFHSSELTCTKYFSEEFGESDHYPVIMELKL